METKNVIGWVMLITTLLFAVVLVCLQFAGNSIPIMLGVSSETSQAVINVFIAIVFGVLLGVAVYLIIDEEVIWVYGTFPAMIVSLLLICSSIYSLPSYRKAVNQLKEATEYSTEMSEYVDPDTGVHYWVQDGGMTPRLNPDGTIMVTSQAESQAEMSEYVDPDTGVHYWVQEDVGMTPRLNPDGTIMVTPQD